MPKKVIIMGASSGIGYELAKKFIDDGWIVGLAARRLDRIKTLIQFADDRVYCKQIDITDSNAPNLLLELIEQIGGLNYYVHSSGIGFKNEDLDINKELDTVQVNGIGFCAMIDTAFNYIKKNNKKGHIAAISSIAGTKGLGPAPAYSATKSFQQTYLQALAQLSNKKGYKITISDIRPGFIKTDLLKGDQYPMLMNKAEASTIIYKAIAKKKRVKTLDRRYWWLVKAWKLIPNCIWEKMKI